MQRREFGDRDNRKVHELSQSFESEESEQEQEFSRIDYLSTSLIHFPNTNLSEIELCQLTYDIVETLEKNQLQYAHQKCIHTLVDYQDIQRLSYKALKLYLRSLVASQSSQPQTKNDLDGKVSEIAASYYNELQERVEAIGQSRTSSEIINPKHQTNSQKKHQSEILKRKEKKLRQVLYYLSLEDLPISKIAQLAKLPQSVIKKIHQGQITDPLLAFQKYKPRQKFKKLHERARQRINQLLVTSKIPLQLQDIQKDLSREIQLHVTKQYLWQYIHEELDVSYRKLRPISQNHNTASSKLQRQYAASQFISLLSRKTTLINVDESLISLTEYRRKSWMPLGIKSKATLPQRPSRLSIIAGISSQGKFYYTINQGKNNSETFYAFILKLCEELSKVDRDWRSSTFILLDNAGYHRSNYIQKKMRMLKLPIFYLGPYQFKLAPIENFFSKIKTGNLNPLDSKLTKKAELHRYIKELGMHISRMNFAWIKKSFIHALVAALEELCLNDL